MFSTADTIVAIATPPGRGGIGVVRISGPEAHRIGCALIGRERPLRPRHATFASIITSSTGQTASAEGGGAPRAGGGAPAAIDHAIATYFPAPHSYTGEDVVELSAHGSPVVLRAIVAAAMTSGARAAEPGEFTLRAFLNGRIDLPQAEAVADLIDAATPLQARAAFDQLQGTLTRTIAGIDAALFDLMARLEASVDFPDEGYHFIDPASLAQSIDRLRRRTSALLADGRRGRIVREGFQAAVVGKPNVGKSSLFNALCGSDRAIVTPVPGTTRDLVTECIDLDGLRLTLVDTAGLRESGDEVEAEGIARSRRAHAVADLVLVILDRSRPLDENDRDVLTQTADYKRLVVINKHDLEAAWPYESVQSAVMVSAATGKGISELRQAIVEALDVDLLADRPAITNLRHLALVERADAALGRACAAALADGAPLSEEFVLADLQDARSALEEISGTRAGDDLLNHIFEKFCIGK